MGLMRLTVTRRPSTHTMVAAVSTRPTGLSRLGHVIVRMSQQLITRTSYIQCPKRESFEIRDTFTNSSQVSDVHPCMRNRTHAPTAKSARPATRFAPATRYIGPQHNPGAKVDTFVRDACKCSLRRDACFESTSRPANARREHTAAGNAPQHPPSTGRMLATPDSRVGRAGRDNHLSCWYGKRIPCKRVSSERGPKLYPSCRRVSSERGPHA